MKKPNELDMFEKLFQLLEKQEKIKLKADILKNETKEVVAKYYDSKMHPIRKENNK